jgi:hypothetical protein
MRAEEINASFARKYTTTLVGPSAALLASFVFGSPTATLCIFLEQVDNHGAGNNSRIVCFIP